MELTDTHCHLYFDDFEKDLHDVIVRAEEAGVTRIIVPGIDLETSRNAIELSEKHKNIFAAVGIHPNSGMNWNDTISKQLLTLGSHLKTVAIGEIGLDYYRDKNPRRIQKELLTNQLTIASELNLPVILHTRDAFEDICPILFQWQEELLKSNPDLSTRPGVFHSFSNGIAFMEVIFQHHFKFGISGVVTYNKAKKLQETISKMPLDGLLLETDAPFLAPHPYRGKRNEPSYIPFVNTKIAAITKREPEEIAEICQQNSSHIFFWSKRT